MTTSSGVGIDDFGASFIKYMPGVVSVYNRTAPGRALVGSDLKDMKWQGDHIEKFIHISRNTAISGAVDGGAIPTAGKQGYTPMKVYRKFQTAAVKITDGALLNASTSENSAISILDSELRGLLTDMRRFSNYNFYRDGSAVVGTLGATVSGATITVSDCRMIWEGGWYEIRDAATPTTVHARFQVATGGVPRTVTAGFSTITLESSIAAAGQAAGDYIVWLGRYQPGVSSYGRVPTGLDALVDDNTGNFQSVNCTTYPRWTSVVLSNGGVARPMTSRLFRQLMAGISQESGDEAKKNWKVFCSKWGGLEFEEMWEGDVRVTENVKVGGIEVARFQSTLGSFDVYPDGDMINDKMLFVDTSEITYAKQKELDWREGGSRGIFNRLDSSLAYTATALEAGEYMIERRNSSGKIEDISIERVTSLG